MATRCGCNTTRSVSNRGMRPDFFGGVIGGAPRNMTPSLYTPLRSRPTFVAVSYLFLCQVVISYLYRAVLFACADLPAFVLVAGDMGVDARCREMNHVVNAVSQRLEVHVFR